MKPILSYLGLLVYSCISSMLMLLFLGGCVAIFYYLKDGVFYFPLSQVKRAIFFGGVAGTAITLATIVFNLIDKFNARKKP
ncbi:hypothetical protein RIN58_00135 [Siccibacter colletis]|uniref:hypothetical protein n=1 Tax=Siccibacter colletis TaxID=1505757 RepID=UPI0028BEE205|nr:hypothetical protein [Siccibacter colletis]WNN48565.1 hypothetical protein RIN58_00135 [Siccibacter colletis]